MTSIADDCDILEWLEETLHADKDKSLQAIEKAEQVCRMCVGKPGLHYCTSFLPAMIRADVGPQLCALEQESKRAWQLWKSIQPRIILQNCKTVEEVHSFAASLFDEQYFYQLRNEVAFLADNRQMSSQDKDTCERIYTSLDDVTELMYSKEVWQLIKQLQQTNQQT